MGWYIAVGVSVKVRRRAYRTTSQNAQTEDFHETDHPAGRPSSRMSGHSMNENLVIQHEPEMPSVSGAFSMTQVIPLPL